MNFSIKNRLNEKHIFLFGMCAIFLFFLVFNYLTPYVGDDYTYMFSWAEPKRIEKISEVFNSIYAHSLIMNGRSIPHFFVQCFLIFNKNLFNIVNSLCSVAFIYVIYKHVNFKRSISVFLLGVCFIMVLFFTPVLGQTMLWLDGSCNYLWGTLFLLTTLYFIRLKYEEEVKFKLYHIIGILILAFLGGGASENTSAAGIFIMFAFVVVSWMKKQRTPKLVYFVILVSIISWCIMIAAPGNFLRLNSFQGEMSLFAKLFTRFSVCINYVKDYQSILMISFIILLIFVYDKENINKFIFSIVLFIASLLSNFAMIAVPDYPARALFGSMSFLFIAVLSLVPIAMEKKEYKKAIFSCFTILVFVTFFDAYNGLTQVYKFHSFVIAREAYIEEEKTKGNLEIVTQSFDAQSKYVATYELVDLGETKDHWTNIVMAKYYGINSIRASKE